MAVIVSFIFFVYMLTDVFYANKSMCVYAFKKHKQNTQYNCSVCFKKKP